MSRLLQIYAQTRRNQSVLQTHQIKYVVSAIAFYFLFECCTSIPNQCPADEYLLRVGSSCFMGNVCCEPKSSTQLNDVLEIPYNLRNLQMIKFDLGWLPEKMFGSFRTNQLIVEESSSEEYLKSHLKKYK